MILADTSVWVDHFRKGDARLSQYLLASNVAIHPFVAAELALGSLAERTKTLSYLGLLPQVKVAHTDEVRQMIEDTRYSVRGSGLSMHT